MPLILVKTTIDKSFDEIIVDKITEATMETLGVPADDVAIKFEESEKRVLDLYLYDQKQNSQQKERTDEVFETLKNKIEEIINQKTGATFRVNLHLIPKERCYRGGKSRF